MEIKILLFGEFDEIQNIKNQVRDEDIEIIGEVSDTSKILEKISSTSADMVLITSTGPMYLQACEQIYLLRPRTIPVAIVDKSNLEEIEKVSETGVHNTIDKSLNQTQLIREIRSIYTNEKNRMRSIESATGFSSKSKVLTVFGTKGGAGRTTLAVNLALELAKRQRKVCIIDANFQFGNVGDVLGINNPNTISELLEEDANPNIDTIRQFLSLHSSGVNVLLAPNNAEDGVNITASQVERIIAALRVYYDYVVIDATPSIDDVLATVLDASSVVLFVTISDVVALRNSKKGLALIEALGAFEKTELILNGTSKFISNRDIEKVLGSPIYHVIPYDYRIAIAASNQGRPFIQSNPDSKLGLSIKELASKIDGSDSRKEATKKSFSFKNILSLGKKR